MSQFEGNYDHVVHFMEATVGVGLEGKARLFADVKQDVP